MFSISLYREKNIFRKNKPMENTDEPNISSDEEATETQIMQKPKRVLNEKQREAVKINLAKGREIRDKNRAIKKEADKKMAEEMIEKKAEKILKTKAKKESKIKELIGLEDNGGDEDVEERIIKKPKKKKIIYREESDSEEELIIKPKRKEKKEVSFAPPPVVPKKPECSIRFI
jgi:hypothetical protein